MHIIVNKNLKNSVLFPRKVKEKLVLRIILNINRNKALVILGIDNYLRTKIL